MDTPITPTAIRPIFKGRVLTLQVESITLPSGHALDAEIVRHPGSVVIIPVTEQGEILLVRQYRHAIGRHAWELAAGSLKPGEAIEAAAVRECHEEVGLLPGAMQALGKLYPTPGYCDELMHFFLATALRTRGEGDPAAQPDEDEDIDVRAFTPAALDAMIASGEITDMKTVAGLALMRAASGRQD